MSDQVRVYGSGNSSQMNGVTVNTPYEDGNKSVSVDDFLQLMIAQMKNMDFSGEGGNESSNYITQLAQISTMEQMQQLAYYSRTNYVMSMVGKEATVATLGLGGAVNKDTGLIEKVSLSGEEFLVYVNGKSYKLSEIMSVQNPGSVSDDALGGIAKSAIVVTKFDDTSAGVRWDPPSEDEGTLEKLTYSVYYSTNPAMTTPEEIKRNGTLSGDANQKKIYSADIAGLQADTTYFVNVIVRTPDGKEYVYQKATLRTDPSD